MFLKKNLCFLRYPKVLLVIVNLLVIVSLTIFGFLKIDLIEFAKASTKQTTLQLTINPVSPPPPAAVGGGAPVTEVIIQGKAYPSSKVTILQDGKLLTSTYADSQANFVIKISDITPGTWTFGVWAEDKEGRKSITFSFTVSITSGMTTTISGIFLSPTIEIEKNTLQRGETLNIFGETSPESDISIFINLPEEIVKKTKAKTDGTWFYSFDTTFLTEGFHSLRAKAISSEGLESIFSETLSFYLLEKIPPEIKVPPEIPEVICPNADLNGDKKVNLIDFSVLLYWWGKANACADQNQNGVVDLPDFSIMMYWWTG